MKSAYLRQLSLKADDRTNIKLKRSTRMGLLPGLDMDDIWSDSNLGGFKRRDDETKRSDDPEESGMMHLYVTVLKIMGLFILINHNN